MQLQTIVYVTDMERSIAFYEGLGFEVAYHGGPVWTAFRGSDGVLALHLVEELPEPGRVAVSLVADGYRRLEGSSNWEIPPATSAAPPGRVRAPCRGVWLARAKG